MKIKVKALSVNQAWQGRRYKTPEYKAYEQELFYLLPKKIEIYQKIELYIKVGFSSKLADIDNIGKLFIDILQKKYSFNDRDIFKIIMEKEIVKKGEEYIDFELKEYK